MIGKKAFESSVRSFGGEERCSTERACLRKTALRDFLQWIAGLGTVRRDAPG
jgi:hypothetical protein